MIGITSKQLGHNTQNSTSQPVFGYDWARTAGNGGDR